MDHHGNRHREEAKRQSPSGCVSGNEAASSSGLNRQGVKRGGLDAQPEDEHTKKYQRQEDEAEGENQEEANEEIDVNMENQDLQPDKGDSDCMFIEHWRGRKPLICQVQGGEPEFWDDISGKPLDTRMVLKAREDEMGEFAKHGVYEKVPTEECWRETGAAPINEMG